MLFHEIYGKYFKTVETILQEAVSGTLTDSQIRNIVMENAFSESLLTITDDSCNSWALIRDDMTTPLENVGVTPLSALQKRWLRTLLEDPRIKLFGNTEKMLQGLENVKPLFKPEDIVWFDQYNDGDPYTLVRYIENFRNILEAFAQKRKVFIHFKGQGNKFHRWECVPYWLEYSAKDDKFRLITKSVKSSRMQTINLGRIVKCELMDDYDERAWEPPEVRHENLVLEVTDDRNALERVMLHFSHHAKEAEYIDDNKYRLSLEYSKEDETELIIRVLSFGPMVKVLSPNGFIEKVKERIKKQMELI